MSELWLALLSFLYSFIHIYLLTNYYEEELDKHLSNLSITIVVSNCFLFLAFFSLFLLLLTKRVWLKCPSIILQILSIILTIGCFTLICKKTGCYGRTTCLYLNLLIYLHTIFLLIFSAILYFIVHFIIFYIRRICAKNHYILLLCGDCKKESINDNKSQIIELDTINIEKSTKKSDNDHFTEHDFEEAVEVKNSENCSDEPYSNTLYFHRDKLQH